jgi:polysaccharide biosynthesis protein PslG
MNRPLAIVLALLALLFHSTDDGGGSWRASLLLGVNAHPLQNIYAIYSPDRVLDQAVRSGVTVVRIDVHWDWLEWTGPGVDRWDPDQLGHLDAFVDAAVQRNLQLMAVVMDTPCWATADPVQACSPTNPTYDWREPPANPRDFGDFVGRLSARYRGRVQYWEIWNEPNLPLFWTHPDPVAYTRLLQAAYSTIKANDPMATVLGGALAPIEAGQPGIATFDYVEAMYAAGAKGSFDALSFHPYTGAPSPTLDQPTAPAHSFPQVVPALHAAMVREGDWRPIWLTETGWPTTPPCADCVGRRVFTSEADQAAYLIDTIRLAQSWDYVAGLVWYELYDRGESTRTAAEDHFGLFRHDLSPKPAVDSLRVVTSSTSDRSWARSPQCPRRRPAGCSD